MKAQDSRRGFALILVLSLVGLLVLVLVSLATLTNLGTRTVSGAEQRVRARQYALAALALARGRLQTLAADDAAITAMAGIAGEAGGSEFRHWSGAWSSGGAFRGWLTSGAEALPTPSLGSNATIVLVGATTVGSRPSSLGAYADEEHVRAGLLAVPAGRVAYWVGDEGVKTSLRLAAERLPSGGFEPSVASTPTNIARLGVAFKNIDVANARHVLAYEQARLLRYNASSFLSAANLQDAFHHTTVGHAQFDPMLGASVHARLNLNTTSAVVWRGLFESYHAQPGVPRFATAGRITTATNTVAAGIAVSNSGKVSFAPYTSIEAFLGSGLLHSALGGTNGVPVAAFADRVRPMLSVRSDTFRIRAYGEATNAAGETTAVAFCEAMVQRTAELLPDGSGRRFVITSFRWLTPADI